MSYIMYYELHFIYHILYIMHYILYIIYNTYHILYIILYHPSVDYFISMSAVLWRFL